MTVVCYQSDRDELRRRVIQWLEAEIIPDGWFSKGSNYSEVLDKYFKASRAVLTLETIEYFLPCHCKVDAMSPPKRLQCVIGLSSWGPERSGMSYSVMVMGLPAAAADRATGVATGQPQTWSIPGSLTWPGEDEGRPGVPVIGQKRTDLRRQKSQRRKDG